MSKDRVEIFEDKWMKKLNCFDQVHTNYTNLSIEEANKLVVKLKEISDNAVEPPCTDKKEQVFNNFIL